jgi:hypothetical protein
MTPQDQTELEAYLEHWAFIFHTAFQSLRKRKYPRDECLHFAEMMGTLIFYESKLHGNKPEVSLGDLMKFMTPGGRA